MNIPNNLKYSEENEWIRIEGETAVVGITDYAQDQLSDVVYVDYLVDEGDSFNQGDPFATVESVKAAADVYMPISGEIISVNENLVDTPEIVNEDPYGDAWMVKIKFSDPSEIDSFMDASAYETFCEEQE